MSTAEIFFEMIFKRPQHETFFEMILNAHNKSKCIDSRYQSEIIHDGQAVVNPEYRLPCNGTHNRITVA